MKSKNDYFYLQEVTKCQNTDNGGAYVSWLAEYSNGFESISFEVNFEEVAILPELHVSELEKIKQKFL